MTPSFRGELTSKEHDVVDSSWAGPVPAQIGGGQGGCNDDHEFFGYRQSI